MSREQDINLEEQNNYPKAFLATGIIIVVAAILCYIIIMDNPPPVVDGTGGILVNYGTTDAGMGKDINSTEEPSVAPNANHEQTSKVTPAPPTEQKTSVETSNEKVVTQDNEDAPAVAPNSKKPGKPATAEVAKPVKKEVVNQAALYKGPSKAGNGGGDGTTNTPGNQGSKNGSPLASNYGEGGNGNGLKGTQWSFAEHPIFKNPDGVPGRVYIDVTIDASGRIIDARANKATRMSDLGLINNCIEIIKNTRLVSTAPGSGIQKTTIPITFDVE